MKNGFKNFLLILATALVVALLVHANVPSKAPTASSATNSLNSAIYDHILQSGTLRCGYVVYAPAVFKDPATDKMTGIMVDIVEEAGKRLNLKIDWAEEVNYTNMIEELKTGRVDAICTNV